MFCRNVGTRKVLSWSGFECAREDSICRQRLWDKGCICRVFHLKAADRSKPRSSREKQKMEGRKEEEEQLLVVVHPISIKIVLIKVS